ncbi:TPA: iron chelate uptake ABC transporter family permease subunit, partial [Klebsiella pneumoniae]|nr:iron chelate uptake ABC transporter family permease subunit [Klebsiella pneumoniae]
MTTSAKTLLLLVLLVLVTGIALNVGKFSLTPQQLWDVIQAKITGNSGADDPALSRDMTVFWQIRLPRIAAALIIGGGLAIAGAAYQGMFRNPLVSPDILGVSAGAGVGAILGIFAGQSMLTIQLFAFTGGLCVVALVYSVARLARQHDP